MTPVPLPGPWLGWVLAAVYPSVRSLISSSTQMTYPYYHPSPAPLKNLLLLLPSTCVLLGQGQTSLNSCWVVQPLSQVFWGIPSS